MSTMSPVTIWQHTMLLQYYWLYSLSYISCPWDIYFITGKLYLLIPFIYFTQPSTPLPSDNPSLFSGSVILFPFWKSSPFQMSRRLVPSAAWDPSPFICLSETPLHVTLPPGDLWQCRETFLVVAHGARAQSTEPCWISYSAQDSPS